MTIDQLRRDYHLAICEGIIRIRRDRDFEYPNFSDVMNNTSISIAWGMLDRLGYTPNFDPLDQRIIDDRFEEITLNFLEKSAILLDSFHTTGMIYTNRLTDYQFDGFQHLGGLKKASKRTNALGTALRGGYIITPDIIVARYPVSDQDINAADLLVSEKDTTASLTPLRQANRPPDTKILHASISCKWTIRSDRAQNTRTEALNLIRNRKGPLPHVLAVTAEPTPHRLASLALGTGDLDCVYHFALHELLETTQALGFQDAHEEIQMMVAGRRLRDISDLPFDLAI
ncbi:MAG: restriction endonuclease [Anaerolineales bacterium]|nr:restriction endonuclease [Anaerolineales bacterium]